MGPQSRRRSVESGAASLFFSAIATKNGRRSGRGLTATAVRSAITTSEKSARASSLRSAGVAASHAPATSARYPAKRRATAPVAGKSAGKESSSRARGVWRACQSARSMSPARYASFSRASFRSIAARSPADDPVARCCAVHAATSSPC